MLQFDQFLYSCIFHLPAFFSAMETFSSASIKCICFFITIIGVGIWVFRRIFFFRFTYVTSVSIVWRKSTPITSASVTGRSVINVFNVDIAKLDRDMPAFAKWIAAKLSNIPLIKEISFVLFRQWKALLQIPVRTLIMKFKANLFDNCA